MAWAPRKIESLCWSERILQKQLVVMGNMDILALRGSVNIHIKGKVSFRHMDGIKTMRMKESIQEFNRK